jgi:hypothetical protein
MVNHALSPKRVTKSPLIFVSRPSVRGGYSSWYFGSAVTAAVTIFLMRIPQSNWEEEKKPKNWMCAVLLLYLVVLALKK